MFYWSVFRVNRSKMLNINVKSEEPLKIYKPAAVLLPV
jgi:hypothetical protein